MLGEVILAFMITTIIFMIVKLLTMIWAFFTPNQHIIAIVLFSVLGFIVAILAAPFVRMRRR